MPTPSAVSLGQLGRFCVVGLASYVTNILAMAALCDLAHVDYVKAYVAVFVFGCCMGYWLNKRFTFGLAARPDRGALLRYLLVNGAMLIVSTVALRLLVDGLHIGPITALMIVAAACAPLSFVAHRAVSYRIPRPGRSMRGTPVAARRKRT